MDEIGAHDTGRSNSQNPILRLQRVDECSSRHSKICIQRLSRLEAVQIGDLLL